MFVHKSVKSDAADGGLAYLTIRCLRLQTNKAQYFQVGCTQ